MLYALFPESAAAGGQGSQNTVQSAEFHGSQPHWAGVTSSPLQNPRSPLLFDLEFLCSKLLHLFLTFILNLLSAMMISIAALSGTVE